MNTNLLRLGEKSGNDYKWRLWWVQLDRNVSLHCSTSSPNNGKAEWAVMVSFSVGDEWFTVYERCSRRRAREMLEAAMAQCKERE